MTAIGTLWTSLAEKWLPAWAWALQPLWQSVLGLGLRLELQQAWALGLLLEWVLVFGQVWPLVWLSAWVLVSVQV